MRALGKPEKREGVSRGVLAIFIVGILAVAGYALAKPTIAIAIKKNPENGLAQVVVDVSSPLGINKAVVDVNGKTAEMVKLPNGLYAYNISLGEDPVILPIKVDVSSALGISSSATASINWAIEDAFTHYAVKNGFSASKAQDFYKQYPNLIENYYPANKSDLLPALYVFDTNSTLLNIAKQKVYVDPNITNKDKVFLDLSKALYDLNEKSLGDPSLNFLGNLTAAEGENPVEVFNRTSLWNTLNLTQQYPIIVTGLSGKDPIVYGETPILVYITNDNFRDAGEYPFAAYALAKQAYAIGNKLLKIDYNQYLIFNGRKYSLREMVNKDFSILANYTRNGKMVLGLKPEELLALIPADHPNKYVIAEYWMRQKVLPHALFYNIWQESIFGWEKYPDFAPYWNGPVFTIYRPEIALKIAMDNLNYFDQGHNSVVDVIKNPDKPLAWGWSAKKWIEWYIGVEEFWGHYWPNTYPETKKDITLLLDEGSNIAKINLYIYGKSLSENYGLGKSKLDEQRIDQSILNAYSVGLPQFNSYTAYPLNTDRAQWKHGEPSFIVLPPDTSLLYQRSPDELLLNDKTYTLNFLSTRKSGVIKDKVPFCKIHLPDISEYVYYKG